MEPYNMPVQMRWSDLDPNFHLRHSVYYDWGALCRVSFLNAQGLTADVMHRLQVGPILFREECVFRKEIRSGDVVAIDLKLTKAKADFSRWSIQHQVLKGDGIVSAIITVDGAWINTALRKLATPPGEVHTVFAEMPRSEMFSWIG
ncbi:MAG TPA: acyl-CoA thioesterase [Chitinophagaceae bacterium]|nr:acyl-CoA thioesterase [Chitinophagaceae bacterium]